MSCLSVSVIIPTYNRPTMVARAVASACTQTYAPYEIIVIDDASSPPLTAADLNCDDPRIKIVRLKRNQGAAAARQVGINEAQGDVIAFLDSDDIWLPNKLEAQIPFLEEAFRANELIAVACGWKNVPENGGLSYQRIPVPSSRVSDFAGGCWFSPGTTVILPKRAFEIVGPFNHQLRRLEDLEWYLRFALAGGQLQVAPIIGAIISIGRRAKSDHISHARQEIANIYNSFQNKAFCNRTKRWLSAYLYVEQAAAERNSGRYLLMVWWLLRSFILVPRFSIPLKDWWR